MTLNDYVASLMVERPDPVGDFARKLGVSRSALNFWLAGARTPRPAMMARIKEATSGAVTPNDFLPAPANVDAAE